ncbi:MAG: hypothetical protein IKO25_04270 [Clostridia bacterium]|nr:hypothetical protein [Clostridia bacterium]
MLRQENTRPYHWADKTMSVLRANQLEACEKDLAGLPFLCLFDNDCTDKDAESFYALSYFPREDLKKKEFSLHTVEQLRIRVLSSFAPELALLSPEEHDLMVRLVLFGGKLTLQDWDELIPARSLVRRLWCRTRREDSGQVLYMPHQLCASALLLLAREGHKKIRDAVELVQESIDNSLYLSGITQASGPVLHLQSLLKGTYAENHPELIERMLFAACDYVYDESGRLVLIHPGLADPEKTLRSLSAASCAFRQMDDVSLQEASDSISDLESPLYEQMLFAITDAVRPELTPEDAVEDLIILAKQDVPLTDMQEVLSSMLVSLPTEEMLKALRDLSSRIPRWLWFSSSRVQ